MSNQLIPVGEKMPDFELIKSGNSFTKNDTNTFKLSDYKGVSNVILSFYPADFSTVCSSQIALYNQLIPTFKEYNAIVVGISIDGPFCHQAFKKYNNLSIELLTDFHPKAAISKQLGVYDQDLGVCQRALYVIDTNGVVQYSYISPMGENPGAKEILETLKEIQKQ